MKDQLTVYKASAGSGKTFRLTVEYIKCLIDNPKAYENILAVTFTNKATEEMKMRILSTLYGLANHLNSTKDYMEKICEELDFSSSKFKDQGSKFKDQGSKFKEEYVARQAKEALHGLLHNYSYFRVETIDRFFQTVLRNLARELDLTPNLRVELGAKEIEHQAVDELIESLKPNSEVMKWIMDFIHSTMDDGRQWNIIENIKKFGEEILKDEYKALVNGNAIRDNVSIASFKKNLYAIKSDCTKVMNDLGKNIIAQIPGGDPLIFTGKGSGVGGYILKISTLNIDDIAEPGKKTKDALNDVTGDAWVGKSGQDSLRQLALDVVKPMFQKAMTTIDALKRKSKSCDVTLAHISELQLIDAIDKKIKESNNENGRFLLSDTQTLLNGMIEGDDSPFIYEKIGSRLSRIMIDEFQDTSVVQWENFKVLLKDCMSHGLGSLIVGDVKQSIYRWRSGDWRLLNNISNEFSQKIGEKTLADNYRSCPDIIRFNNTFFRIASEKIYEQESLFLPAAEANMLKNAYSYSTLCQMIPEKDRSGDSTDGLVEVVSIHDDDDEAYTEKAYNTLIETINKLLEKGVKQNKIAILVRSNYHISPMADRLMKDIPGLRVVSDEAFRLDASQAVGIIIDAMRVINTPEDNIAKARLISNYQKAIIGNSQDIADIILDEDLDKYLPEEFTQSIEKLSTLPLYQLAERLYSIFHLSDISGEAAFVCTLFDSISEFISHQIATLSAWLRHWNEKICSKTIESDSDDGLRILSIHKSKGLAFDHVICPFMDWKMNKSHIIWAKPDLAPFDNLNVIPLDYTEKLNGSIYEHDYRYEHLQNAVDDLNLMYVAFTRTKKNLFVITRCLESDRKRKDNRSVLINDTLETMMTENAGTADGIAYKPLEIKKDVLEDGTAIYTYGTDICVESRESRVESRESSVESRLSKDEKVNVFETKPEPLSIGNVITFDKKQEFRQSNESKAFTSTDEGEMQRNTYIQLGNILHYALQMIKNADDIDRVVFEIEKEGLLFGQDVTAEDIKQKLHRCFNNPLIKSWFSDEWNVYNECTILEPDGNSFVQHRPDRVIMNANETIVIDFKLSHANPLYKDQVRRYMNLLKSMGHKNVKGYLLYILPAKTEPVNE